MGDKNLSSRGWAAVDVGSCGDKTFACCCPSVESCTVLGIFLKFGKVAELGVGGICGFVMVAEIGGTVGFDAGVTS